MKPKILLTFCLLACSIWHTEAQITFQKAYGGASADRNATVRQTTDGGFIIAGETSSYGAASSDVYAIKTNAYGDTQWTKTYGGTDADGASDVQQTTDGGYIITGYTKSFGAGNLDVYLIKTNATGTVLWSKTIGGTNVDFGKSVHEIAGGGYIISGETASFGAGGYDMYLIKTDASGTLLWARAIGGTSADGSYCAQQTTDGGYAVIGYSGSFGAGIQDVFLVKTDMSGNTLWSKTYGGTGADVGNSIHEITGGDFIISGYTNSFGAGDYDALIMKTDATGTSTWAKTFGGTGLEKSYCNYPTSDGGYIISGETSSFGAGSSDGYLVRVDATGALLWSKTFGGTADDLCGTVQQTADGGYVASGYTNNFGAGGNDIYVIKCETSGNSGCHEGSPTSIAGTPALSFASPTASNSPGGTATSPATISGFGSIVSTLCIDSAISLGISSNGNKMSLNPNPSAGQINIDFNHTPDVAIVEVFDVVGKRVFIKTTHQRSSLKIDLEGIADGVYFLTVNTGEQRFGQRIVVAH